MLLNNWTAFKLSEDGVTLTLQAGVFSLDGSEAIILSETAVVEPPKAVEKYVTYTTS